MAGSSFIRRAKNFELENNLLLFVKSPNVKLLYLTNEDAIHKNLFLKNLHQKIVTRAEINYIPWSIKNLSCN